MESTATKRIPKKKILEPDDEDEPTAATTVSQNVPDLNKHSRTEKQSASSSSLTSKYFSSSNNPLLQSKPLVQQAVSTNSIIDVQSSSQSTQSKLASTTSPVKIHSLPVNKRIIKKTSASTEFNRPRKSGVPDWIKAMTESVLNNEVIILTRNSLILFKYVQTTIGFSRS